MSTLRTQDQIKEELAQLDELVYAIDSDDSIKVLEDCNEEPSLDVRDLPCNEGEVSGATLEIHVVVSLLGCDCLAGLGGDVGTG